MGPKLSADDLAQKIVLETEALLRPTGQRDEQQQQNISRFRRNPVLVSAHSRSLRINSSFDCSLDHVFDRR